MRDTAGSLWAYTYDMVGNRLAADDPDLGNWTYEYDLASRLIRQTDARGTATYLKYDQMGRLLERCLVLATACTGSDVLAKNTYDEARANFYNIGQLTTSENPAVWHQINYHASGQEQQRWTSVADPAGSILNSRGTAFDNASHKPIYMGYGAGGEAATEVGSASQPWTYNARGLLRSIPNHIEAIEYGPDDQTKSITYVGPNGTGATTEFTHSPTRRWLNNLTTRNAAGSIILSSTYTRDLAGRITAIDGGAAGDPSTAHDWTYVYNKHDRLLSATNGSVAALSESFTYQPNGNLVSRTRLAGSFTYPAASADRPHAPTKLGAATISYDANGNVTCDNGVYASCAGRKFDWDEANRLKQVTATIGATTITTSFVYGPDGARVKKSSSNATVKTLFPTPDVEIKATGLAPAIGDFTRYPHPDIKIEGTVRQVLLRDHLASVRMVTYGGGLLIERTGYAAYGEGIGGATRPRARGFLQPLRPMIGAPNSSSATTNTVAP